MVPIASVVPPMSPVHEQVEQGAGQEQQVRQNPKQMRPVFRDQEERGDREEGEQNWTRS